MKPKALFLMTEGLLPKTFRPDDLARLTELLDFVGPPVTSVDLARAREGFSSIEVICSSYGAPKFTEEVLNGLPGLRVIFHAGGTIKTIMTEAAYSRGIRVTSAASANARPVAEFALAQVIFGLKRVLPQARLMRFNETNAYREDPLIRGTCGSTVGILSLGMIGRRVAQLLKILDVRILAYDPTIGAIGAESLGVELCPLEEIFVRSEVVTCHMPLLPETKHVLRGHHFASMPPGATFVNTARGALVHEEEFISVMRERPDLSAALDVTSPEPPVAGSPLYSLPNVMLTPHLAGSMAGEIYRMGALVLAEARHYLRGEPLEHEVTLETLRLLA